MDWLVRRGRGKEETCGGRGLVVLFISCQPRPTLIGKRRRRSKEEDMENRCLDRDGWKNENENEDIERKQDWERVEKKDYAHIRKVKSVCQCVSASE